MKCEIISEGQACNNTADVVVRTPWTTQLACFGCATPFKRYDVEKLEFFCDWPMGGKECGEKATHYVAVLDWPKSYHRPLCVTHAKRVISNTNGDGAKLIDDDFDPKLVPRKPPVQTQARVEQVGEKVYLRCHCGRPGKYRGGVEPMPLCDEHAPALTTPKAESPSIAPVALTNDDIQARLKDLALLTIQILKEKLQKWQAR